MAAATVDLVVLDIMLPGEDGAQHLSPVAGGSSFPIIMLTARGTDVDPHRRPRDRRRRLRRQAVQFTRAGRPDPRPRCARPGGRDGSRLQCRGR